MVGIISLYLVDRTDSWFNNWNRIEKTIVWDEFEDPCVRDLEI